MILSRWLACAVSGAVVWTGLVCRPTAANDVGKEATCPVMGARFKVTSATRHATVNGRPVYFCCAGCPEAFARDPEKFAAKLGDLSCPVMEGAPVTPNKALRILVNDGYVYTCCAGCPPAVTGTPYKYLTYELRDPVSGKMFKVSANQPYVEYKGVHYFFAGADTKSAFEKSPDKYARKVN